MEYDSSSVDCRVEPSPRSSLSDVHVRSNTERETQITSVSVRSVNFSKKADFLNYGDGKERSGYPDKEPARSSNPFNRLPPGVIEK